MWYLLGALGIIVVIGLVIVVKILRGLGKLVANIFMVLLGGRWVD
jgi:hypothetical protein